MRLDDMLDDAAMWDNPATSPPVDDAPAPSPVDDVSAYTVPVDDAPHGYELPAPSPPVSSDDANNSPAVVISTSAALQGRSNVDTSAITAAVQSARTRFGLTLDDTQSDVDSIIHLAGGDPALVTQATIDRFVNAKYPTWAAPTASHGGRGGSEDINYDGIVDAIQAHVVAATADDTYMGVNDWMTTAQIAALVAPPLPFVRPPGVLTLGPSGAPVMTTLGGGAPLLHPATGGGGGSGTYQPFVDSVAVTGPGLFAASGSSAAPASPIVPLAIFAALLKLIGVF